tara:strand:+ start:5791 stop:7488 length:1698 start_codon:yes stop_codon:yes gene_type:complete
LASARTPIDPGNLLVLVAAGLLFLSYGYTEMAGADMWWHIAAGRELVQTGTLWMVDDWSFTAHGKDWLNHEWLADLLYYGWVTAWGVESLVYWKWLTVVATFGALLLALSRVCGSPIAALICTGFALATAAPFLDVRPHLYSLLGFSLLLFFRLQRPASTWVLALIFLLWVNLHGGVFFGLMALGILLFPWREPSFASLRTAVWVGAICVLAAMLNPSGFKVFLYPLAYAFDAASPFRQIGEWLTPFKRGGITSPLFFYLMWLPLLAPIYLVPAVRRALVVPWEGVALTALTLAMALTSRRFIPLFSISLAVMFAPLLALWLQKLRLQRYSPGLAVLALLFGLYRLLPYPTQSGPAFHYLTAEYSFPVEMLNFIEANGITGNVYALWNWGGYIHWRTDGGLKVYVDGRADTIYDDETYNRYVTVLGSRPGWLELVEQSDADYILWSHSRGKGREKLRALVDTGRWRPLYSDAVSWLLARKEAVPEEEYVPTSPGPWRDLALARNSEWAGNSEQAIYYAQQVRELMPWHKDACSLMITSYRVQGRPQAAEDLLDDCRSYFPTAYLR